MRASFVHTNSGENRDSLRSCMVSGFPASASWINPGELQLPCRKVPWMRRGQVRSLAGIPSFSLLPCFPEGGPGVQPLAGAQARRSLEEFAEACRLGSLVSLSLCKANGGGHLFPGTVILHLPVDIHHLLRSHCLFVVSADLPPSQHN